MLELLVGHLFFHSHGGENGLHGVKVNLAPQLIEHSHHFSLVHGAVTIGVVNVEQDGGFLCEVAVLDDVYEVIKLLEVEFSVVVLVELLKYGVKLLDVDVDFERGEDLRHLLLVEVAVAGGVEFQEYGLYFFLAHFVNA